MSYAVVHSGAMVRLTSLALASLLVGIGCSQSAENEDAEASDQDFSSREAVQLDFELDGELVTDSTFNVKAKIQDQFLYTIGHLNGDRSVGRLDKLALTNVQQSTQLALYFVVKSSRPAYETFFGMVNA